MRVASSAFLFSGFGVVALLLAAIGLYGVIASVVREQTRDIGVRMALGATPQPIRRGVLGTAMVVVSVGGATGAAAAYLPARRATQIDPANALRSE